MARRKLRPQNEVIDRARALQDDVRAALARLPSDDPAVIDAVWRGEAESDNVVAVYVGYLRQKLGEPRLLHTVRGAGYALHE